MTFNRNENLQAESTFEEMQIGGYVMESGDTPEAVLSPDMGVIVKREPMESMPMIVTPTTEDTHDHWDMEGYTLRNETPDFSFKNHSRPLSDESSAVSVIQKNENALYNNIAAKTINSTSRKPYFPKSHLKYHLETNLQQYVQPKKNLNLQEEIYQQQNSLINKEDKIKLVDVDKLNACIQKTDVEPIAMEKCNEELMKLSFESLPNESIKSWLQRITRLQNEMQKHRGSVVELPSTPETHSAPLLSKQGDSKRKIQSAPALSNAIPHANPPQTPRVVNYQDLPYMGEMTLDNCKPRRGRKPKKADICHLIYKNYGTIIPGTPQNPAEPTDTANEKKVENTTCRTDIQNKIISSLLEKRLTLETKRNREKEASTKVKPVGETTAKNEQEEPLNLCIRDLNQLKIRLLRRHDNIYESQNMDIPAVEVKREPQSDDEVEFVNETKISSPTVIKKTPDLLPSDILLNEKTNQDTEVAPGGYVFWPNAGVFVHPMALQSQMLYYQKMAANNNYVLPSPGSRPPSNASSNSSILPVPKKTPSESPNLEVVEGKVKRTNHNSTSAPPTKRKRSAIFIPPIPTENQTNPATEVSICKFKFTGGAKPSLQEKKMLSVDSGGNFRYYSGTGDKSMRGYEFFPRETLQQQANGQNTSSSGVFLNASGEKLPIPPHLQENSPAVRPHFLLSADPLVLHQGNNQPSISQETNASRHKKRKTRKSIQREKLEQTFKEKGFLIQTQQLESAEGATYCKFRQLRKFTRYLFRSWKDYLPGNVRDMQIEGVVDKSDDEFDIATSTNPGTMLEEVSASSDITLPERTTTV